MDCGRGGGVFLPFLWMLEVAWHYKNITIPNFNLSFDKNGMGIVLAEHPNLKSGPTLGTTQETNEKAAYVRIRVDALSKTTIKGCFAFITALEKQPKGTTAFTHIALPQPIPLKGQQFDIIPEVPCMLDFLMSGEWDNRLVSPTYWPFILRDVFKDEATYRFTFIVNGDGVSKTKRVDVIWKGKWDSIEAVQVAG